MSTKIPHPEHCPENRPAAQPSGRNNLSLTSDIHLLVVYTVIIYICINYFFIYRCSFGKSLRAFLVVSIIICSGFSPLIFAIMSQDD